jgi:DNA-binding NarL/FixJ family response regulator
MSRIYFHQTSEISDNLSDKIIEAIKTNIIAEVISFLKTTKDNFLPWNYRHEQPDVMLIPAILDASNSVSYDGVEFALQWYFYKIQNNKEFAIILLGIESKAAFFEHCDYSFVIKCPNVHYVEFSMDEIKRSVSEIQPKYFEKEQYIQSLNNIGIKPPTSYKSHHSITNEWSIYRWSKYLEIGSQLHKTLDEEVKNSLYYNYLQTIYPIDETGSQKYKILEKGNILLVDDEVDKGWSDFFKELSTSNQKFKAIGENFKKLTQEEIINTTIGVVAKFEPDVVILDLRLHDVDFDEKPTTELSGIKILQKLKSINRGIQVLAFTASNKIWNYQKLQQLGIDGFILKESPELSIDNDFTKNAIIDLKNSIEGALKRKYLREIYKFWDLAKKENSNPDTNFIHESDSMLHIAWNLINQEQLDLGYLTLFQIIESYANKKYDYRDNSIELEGVKNYMIEIDGDKEKWKLTFNRDNRNGDYFSSGDEHKSRGVRAYTLYKASCILKFNYNKDDSFLREFGNLNDLRHKIAHEGAKGQVNNENIKKVLEIIKMKRQ